MRWLLILLVLTSASSAIAQQPVIDSVVTYESKNLMLVYGNFGATQGFVWLDSAQLPIVRWTDTLIICTPRSDSIWVGPVAVGVGSARSKDRMLTGYILTPQYNDIESNNRKGETFYYSAGEEWTAAFRLDLLHAIQDSASTFEIIPSKSYCRLNLAGEGSNLGADGNYVNTNESGIVDDPASSSDVGITFLSAGRTLHVTTTGNDNMTVTWTTTIEKNPPSSTNGSYSVNGPALTLDYKLDTSYDFISDSAKVNGSFAEEFVHDPNSVEKGSGIDFVSPVFPPPPAAKSSVTPIAKNDLSLAISPNPFTSNANLQFTLPRDDYSSIEIVDVCGRIVKTLATGMLSAGRHILAVDASALPTGVYLCRAQIGGSTSTVSMVKVR